MRKFRKITFFLLLFLTCWISGVCKNKIVYVIPLNTEVGSTSWRYVDRGLQEAGKENAYVVILHMNTYGGTLVHADSIRTAILNYNRPVYAFIDNNAASAGALIAIACDSIFMRSGGSIGAATVVDDKGTEMPDKYQSYMRSIIRATAESHGKVKRVNDKGDTIVTWFRDPAIAEAMVDSRISVPSIGDDSTKVVTLTSQEALKYHYSDGDAESVTDIVKNKLHYDDYSIKEFKPSFWDNLIGFLTNPALQAILIMIIIGGIYFELQTPGMGFPSFAAIVAAVLYFLPLYIEGVAESWEIIVFVIGIILLLLEIFVIPGFGVTGISGIVLIVGSLFFALIDNFNFNFEYVSSHNILVAMITVMIGVILAVALVLYLSHKIGSKGLMGKSALKLEQNVKDGYVGVPQELAQFVGKTGVTTTVLRPSGKIEIDGVVYDAVSQNEFLDAGTSVRVVKYENTQLYVVKQ